MTDLQEFDPSQALIVLARHGVRFVLIGGLAANALGSPSITGDLDICHDRRDDNLESLAAALRDMKATLRGAPPDLPFLLDALTLKRGDSFTFTTVAGDLDVLGTPRGTQGYDDLRVNALSMRLYGIDVAVCSLEDLIRMKTAAGRTKDRIELEVLGGLRDEVEGYPED